MEKQTYSIINQLIKISDKLDKSGLTKEADELDLIIEKFAQQWPPPGASLDNASEEVDLKGTIDSIKRILQTQLDEKVRGLYEIANSKPEGAHHSKRSWMEEQLRRSPIIIQFPSK